MSRTSILVLVALLLAAVVGIGWSLRSDPPTGRVTAAQKPVIAPDVQGPPPSLSGAHGEERSSVATTPEAAVSATTERESEDPLSAAHAQSTPDPEPRVLVALRTPTGDPFPIWDIMLFLPRAGASRDHPGETWGDGDATGELVLCGEMAREGSDPTRGVLGSIALRCAPPVWISLLHGTRVIDAQVLVAGQDEVVFVLDPIEVEAGLCSVRFRGVDAMTGDPLSQVKANKFSGGALATFPPVDGASFSIERLRPGPLKVTLSGAGHGSVTREATLEPGSDVDLGDIPLPALQREPLRVLVRRPDGAHDVVIHALPTEWLTKPGGPMSVSIWKQEVGDDEDQATIQLGLGTWGIWLEGRSAQGELRSPTLRIEIAAGGGEATLELVRPVSVTLRNGPERAAALPRTLDGLWAQEPAYLAPDEEKRIELVPGSYDLVVYVEGRDERVIPLQVGTQETTIDLR